MTMQQAEAAKEMDREHFGTYLRKQREARGMSLPELSRATKIKEASLVLLEAGDLTSLPARVFVVGWTRAYARAVGADACEAVARLDALAPALPPVEIGDCMPKVVARAPETDDPSGSWLPDRRRVGVVVVVFLLLIVATLTLSLLLGHGGHVGGPLS
jgi:cytoskeleton protein RodZ